VEEPKRRNYLSAETRRKKHIGRRRGEKKRGCRKGNDESNSTHLKTKKGPSFDSSSVKKKGKEKKEVQERGMKRVQSTSDINAAEIKRGGGDKFRHPSFAEGKGKKRRRKTGQKEKKEKLRGSGLRVRRITMRTGRRRKEGG